MTRWRAGAAMAFIAAIAAVISYNDGLAVARLAGVTGRVAYLYPLLPDGLIVICLVALYEGARMTEPQRPAWASAGLVLGAGLTLAQNVGAGAAVSGLLAVIDGFVPVVFFVAAEVLIWTIRNSRPAVTAGTVPSPVFTDAQTAALAALERTAAAGNPLSQNKLMAQFRLSRAEARDVVGRSRGVLPILAPAPAARAAPAAVPPSAAGAMNGSHG